MLLVLNNDLKKVKHGIATDFLNQSPNDKVQISNMTIPILIYEGDSKITNVLIYYMVSEIKPVYREKKSI